MLSLLTLDRMTGVQDKVSKYNMVAGVECGENSKQFKEVGAIRRLSVHVRRTFVANKCRVGIRS